jgi:hypothetical protein
MKYGSHGNMVLLSSLPHPEKKKVTKYLSFLNKTYFENF